MAVGVARYAWKAGRQIGKYFAKRKWQSSQSSGKRAKGRQIGSLSEQRDSTTLYARRRAPRRVRRAARRYMKRFTYSMDKLQSMKTCIINNSTQIAWAPTSFANGQTANAVTMYGYETNTYASNIAPGNGDMPWIFARENGGYPSSSDASRKLRFRSCCITYSLQNNYDEGAYIDMYFVIARKNNGSEADPANEWIQSLHEQAAGNMPVAVTSFTTYGVTPFDAPAFGRYWLIKRRRRVFLQPNEIYSFQQRDAGNYVLNMGDIFNLKSKANLTEGVIFVYSNPNCTGSEPGGGNVQLTYTKTYHYTETSSSIDAIGTS